MIVPTDIETFIAEHMLNPIPVDRVARIYRAGCPWPLLSMELGQVAERDAKAIGVSAEIAADALEPLSRVDMEKWNVANEIATQAAARGNLSYFEMMGEHPFVRRKMDYCQRVAQLLGEEFLIVLDLYLRVSEYADLNPDWDPERA